MAFKGYDTSKFRYHLLHGGKQAKCPAVSNYISTLLKEIVAEDNLNPDGTTRKPMDAQTPPAPPVPNTNADVDEATVTPPPIPAVNDVEHDDPSSATPFPVVNGEEGGSSTVPPLPAVSGNGDGQT